MKPLYVRRLSPGYRGIPLHGDIDGQPLPLPWRAMAAARYAVVCSVMVSWLHG
jgi:hypothetical protein